MSSWHQTGYTLLVTTTAQSIRRSMVPTGARLCEDVETFSSAEVNRIGWWKWNSPRYITLLPGELTNTFLNKLPMLSLLVGTDQSTPNTNMKSLTFPNSRYYFILLYSHHHNIYMTSLSPGQVSYCTKDPLTGPTPKTSVSGRWEVSSLRVFSVS